MDGLMTGRYRNVFTINVNKVNEVEEWCQKWAVTHEQIKEAELKAKSNSVAGIHEVLTELGYTTLVL